MSVNQNNEYGVHQADIVLRMTPNDFISNRKWDGDSMFVTMPHGVTSLHIERWRTVDESGKPCCLFNVTAAEPASELACSLLSKAQETTQTLEWCNVDGVKALVNLVLNSQTNKVTGRSAEGCFLDR